MKLNADFLDFLQALHEEGAEFLVVGAYAMAAHGVPRATGDLDVWIRNSEENVRRVWQALLTFGAPVPCVGLAELEENKRATGRPKDLLDIQALRGETSGDV